MILSACLFVCLFVFACLIVRGSVCGDVRSSSENNHFVQIKLLINVSVMSMGVMRKISLDLFSTKVLDIHVIYVYPSIGKKYRQKLCI